MTVLHLFGTGPASRLGTSLKTSAEAPFQTNHQIPVLPVCTLDAPRLYLTSNEMRRNYVFVYSNIVFFDMSTGYSINFINEKSAAEAGGQICWDVRRSLRMSNRVAGKFQLSSKFMPIRHPALEPKVRRYQWCQSLNLIYMSLPVK